MHMRMHMHMHTHMHMHMHMHMQCVRGACGYKILVISCLRNLRSYAAAMTRDETKEQSVMIVCVIVSDETR